MKNNKGGKIKINLGCGEKYLDGYINCDFVSSVRVDKQFNLNEIPYPFKNNYADEILMDNVLEHLDDIVKVTEEIYRILKNNGRLIIIVPYGKSDGAMQDPTHRHFFTERTMDYFTDNSLLKFYSNARFKMVKVKLFTKDFSTIHRLRTLIPFRNILKHLFFNMYDTVYFELKAVK